MIRVCKDCKGKGYHESYNQICICDCKIKRSVFRYAKKKYNL